MKNFRLCTLSVLLVNLCAVARAGDLPNIIHIIADDLGWNDVSFHGSDIQTPAIDRLAADSVILERFYVTPICSPTRAGVLTGRYPFRYGLWGGVVSPTHRHGLPPRELTAPELLAARGYQQRALLGKWHLGLASTAFHPLRHGFTEFYGHYNGAVDYFTRHRSGQLDWHRNFDRLDEEGYATDLIGNAAVDFIRRQSPSSPFYLLVTFNAPHSPLQATRPDLLASGFDPAGEVAPNTDRAIALREAAPNYGEGGKGNTVRQTFAAMTRALDRNVSKILDAVDQCGFGHNSLIVFHSDNGADPKHGGSNQPLRGNKFTTWEGGVRVVAMLRWPARLPGGQRFSTPASYVDMLPTQLAAAGAPIPQNLDGINLLPYLQDEPLAAPERSILLGEDAAVCGRWKLKGEALFDLVNDPSETADVSAVHPERVRQLAEVTANFANWNGPEFVTSLAMPDTWPPADWRLPEEDAASNP